MEWNGNEKERKKLPFVFLYCLAWCLGVVI